MTIFRTLLSSLVLFALLPSGLVFSQDVKSTTAPLPKNIGEWVRQGNPAIYKGEDLFLYINGGADIYHEYGFREVISSEYEKEGAGRISVELYRMNDPASAFGIFSFRTGGKWENTGGSNLSSSDGYYLNLLAGNHLITITSIDINEETGKGIHVIRKFMEEKTPVPAVIPDIIQKVPPRKYPVRIYFEGDLGLMNNYNLFSASSGILRGAAGIGKNSRVILLEFPSGKTAEQTIATLWETIKKEGRYSGFGSTKGGIHFEDRKKNRLMITRIGETIAVFIETDLHKCQDSAENLREFIRSFK